ncbi:AbrB/MazE/SpoVT family DNA-binding domain-containing protein [Lysinibacillus mangiferihumi]|uniref:AbrB/MazE/SpoVT family DNA-binding domain-containing protein n=1 Tax=Lysinibacillus mangiferihumi TaxID=1130819 RepID=A0A4U2Y0W2_9BACI|nr:AbrB/MazE/SpoVT family DNA-binding domain-containing protein [Lysinibacillus mangiferihumi]TKI53132.1 AbrB/MazE/SpoVT family DNA-binding domain-containing protein [Lysinibacillus mangiferihumi]
MKSTGMIRKVDNLGRLVIPAELRNVLGIDKLDSLEIFTDGDKIVIQKYQPNAEMEEVTAELEKLVAEAKSQNAIDVLQRAIKLIK